MTTNRDDTGRIRELLELDRSSLPPDGGERFNRLVFESSPYLLQHAENPVQWYPWGEDAFATARNEDKPVFLSIGYATCHWCHVMAHESFEDPEVAAVVNRHFVPVKVDREERPDIDDQYMLVSQMMTGSGGWPLNIVMTPDRQPFFTVTYLPRHPRMGMSGIIEVLENIARVWRTRRDLVGKNVTAVMEGISLQRATPASSGVPTQLGSAAWEQLRRMYDTECGGFGNAPKFPMPHYISFLIRYGSRNHAAEPLRMAARILDIMRQGGICDQLGYGFHRYATDRHWLIPHFEKMLYDQALIADTCLDAFQGTSQPRFLSMAEEIFAFVASELTSPEGGFYAALDADSEGVEGKFYVWTPDEIQVLLGEEDARIFCDLFDVTERGNFEGENILHLDHPVTEFAVAKGIASEEISAKLVAWRERLLEARARRIRPLRDEKILTSWNGLMIAALARGYALTGTEAYLVAAVQAATFVENALVSAGGRLLRSWHHERLGPPAFLEDYAFLIHGVIALHQATLDDRYLDAALRFAGELLRLFGDDDDGACFDTGSDAETALIRMKGINDGVVPSGNGMAATVLVRVGLIAGDETLVRRGEKIIVACAGSMERMPVNHLQFLTAHELLEGDPIVVTLSGDRGAPGFRAMLQAVHRSRVPGVILRYEEGSAFLQAAVCAAGTCRQPVTETGELERLLDSLDFIP